MTNKELAATFRLLADRYDSEPELPQIDLTIYAWSKDALINAIRSFGGSFAKKLDGSFIRLSSKDFPGFTITASRDSVCRKIVTYECEPILKLDSDKDTITPEDLVNA